MQREFPGVGIIPSGRRSATMAVTIAAPPEEVWPWLIQMGADRAGWYSWDHLDNGGRPSAESVNPEWQEISAGDNFAGTADGSQGWRVAALEPQRFLGLRMSLDLRGRMFDPAGPVPRHFSDSLWGFLLESLPGGGTRLVVSGYWSMRPRWLQPLLNVSLLEPSHWVMQVRQFSNLKRRIERRAT